MYRSVIYYSFFIEIVVFAFPKAIFDRLAQAGQMDGYMQHYSGGSRISDQIFTT